ncbi:fibronectin type III domain-containing protein [candidate division KSB1 bacterium]|nr:fibronectin type III domain-containing protein [candidate division KSB1 bacterium]
MGKIRCFILILGVLLFILNCTEKSTQPVITPDRVQMIPSGLPYDKIESGIDAVPESNDIYLEWLDPDDPGVEFYEIYRSEDPAERFVPVGKVFDPDTSFSDEDVDLFTRYYYYVLAVSDQNTRSESSDTLFYTLLEKPTNLSPSGVREETKPQLRWELVDGEDHYLARIMDNQLDEIIWMAELEFQYNNPVTVNFDSANVISIDSLQRNRDYNWRVDVLRQEYNSGSESLWVPLRIE